MLQKAYRESTLSKTRAYEWYSVFKSGGDVVEDLSIKNQGNVDCFLRLSWYCALGIRIRKSHGK